MLVTLQVILLAAVLLLLALTLTAGSYVAVPALLGIAIVLQVLALIRFVEAHVDTLEEFVAAVDFGDFTRRFVGDDIDAELGEVFNGVLSRLRAARAERNVQAGYLELVVRHVPVPLLAARADGTLKLVNAPARRLTGLPALTHIRELAALDPALPKAMQELKPGSQQLLRARVRGRPAELRVSVSEIRLNDGLERLFSIENLAGELTARESSAWRNLIRVLTHEIMNTLTPVTSLAQTAAGLLEDDSAKADVQDAVRAIARRSEGLTSFVLRYRELMTVPQPEPARVNVGDALQSVVALMRPETGSAVISIEVDSPSLEVMADRTLLDQVLVNVVRNALDAVRDTARPRLELRGELDQGRVVISVTDNGPGIDEDVVRQVFIPFFTTKRDGSGIGLSLCQQVMTAHGGEIALESGPAGTTVRLIF